MQYKWKKNKLNSLSPLNSSVFLFELQASFLMGFFLIMTFWKQKNMWVCSLLVTRVDNSVPQNVSSWKSLIQICNYSVFCCCFFLCSPSLRSQCSWSSCFLYLLAQTLTRMYGYCNSCSPPLFLKIEAFKATKLNCQFFVFQMSWYACCSCIFIMVYITSVFIY